MLRLSFRRSGVLHYVPVIETIHHKNNKKSRATAVRCALSAELCPNHHMLDACADDRWRMYDGRLGLDAYAYADLLSRTG